MITVPFFALLTACGLSGSLTLAELDADQVTTLCEDEAGRDSLTVTCDGKEFTFEPVSASACAEAIELIPDTCGATVGDYRDCADATFGLSEEEACDPETEITECDIFLDADCIKSTK